MTFINAIKKCSNARKKLQSLYFQKRNHLLEVRQKSNQPYRNHPPLMLVKHEVQEGGKSGKSFSQSVKSKICSPKSETIIPSCSTRSKDKLRKTSLFTENWRKSSGDPNILEIVQGWKLSLIKKTHQIREPKGNNMSETERLILEREVTSMLKKGAIKEVTSQKHQFLSTIFVRPKKEKNKYRPIINLKQLNQYLPYNHFKKEEMENVKK